MSQLNLLFAAQLAQADLLQPEREYQFCEGRDWAFDFAWPTLYIAVEIDGGTWLTTPRGRSAGHAHPARIVLDNEKRNTARAMGWQVYQFTGEAVNDNSAFEMMRDVLSGHFKPNTSTK